MKRSTLMPDGSNISSKLANLLQIFFILLPQMNQLFVASLVYWFNGAIYEILYTLSAFIAQSSCALKLY